MAKLSLHEDYRFLFDKQMIAALLSVNMNAQNIFYILADIFMVLAILIQIALIALVIVIIVQARKAEHTIKVFLNKAEHELSKLTEPKKALGIIPLVISGISWFRNRKKK